MLRIDILERLFVKIIENNNKNNKTKLESGMMNLVGLHVKKILLNYLNQCITNLIKGDKRKRNILSVTYQKDTMVTKKILLKKYNKNDNPFKMLNNVNYQSKIMITGKFFKKEEKRYRRNAK